MKANLKKAIMASAVFGMLAGPYFVSDADAICLIACSRRTNAASTTNQTELNSLYGTSQGHTLDTKASQYQYGDISVGNFGNGNFVAGGPVVAVGGDVTGSAVASQSNNFGIVGSNIGHTQLVGPSAAGDTSTSNSAANLAASRTSIPTSQGDRDMVSTNIK
jgi:hypothetical protein